MSRSILAPPAVAVAVAVSALGLTAPAAPAKQVTQALACGASGCRDVTGRIGHDEAILQTGAIDPGPTKHARFFRIRFRIGNGDGSGQSFPGGRMVYVPSLRLTGSLDESTGRRVWFRMSADSVRTFQHAVRGLAPLAARRLPLPRVGGDVSTVTPPPAAIAPTLQGKRSGNGFRAWPGLALLVPIGGAVALLAGRRRARHHRNGSQGPPPTAA
jgi:hypothetical protein